MPTLVLTKNYLDGTLLLADDFDVFLDELEALLNTDKLSGVNILDDGITGSSKILGNTTTTAKLQANSVTTAKLEDEAVDTAYINDLAVTTAKILDSNVTTAKIASSAVTNAKLAAGSVTTPKFSYSTVINSSQVADTSGTTFGFTTTSATITASTEKVLGSSSITSVGRPIWIVLTAKQFDGSSSFTDVAIGSNTGSVTTPTAAGVEGIGVNDVSTSMGGVLTVYRNASAIYSTTFNTYCNLTGSSTNRSYFPMALSFIDQPAAGTYTYTIGIEASSSCSLVISNVQLNVMEC